MCFTIIYSILFSYSTDKTESLWANPRYTQCLKCFSYLLTAVCTNKIKGQQWTSSLLWSPRPSIWGSIKELKKIWYVLPVLAWIRITTPQLFFLPSSSNHFWLSTLPGKQEVRPLNQDSTVERRKKKAKKKVRKSFRNDAGLEELNWFLPTKRAKKATKEKERKKEGKKRKKKMKKMYLNDDSEWIVSFLFLLFLFFCTLSFSFFAFQSIVWGRRLTLWGKVGW